MKITILGCGASSGVPLIGCRCPVCLSDNPRNQRSRASILIETNGKRILVDTSPDLRHQCLREGIDKVDAILFTHAHADHIHGIDDIRSLNHYRGGPIPAYGDVATMDELQERFAYAFREPVQAYGWFRPCLDPVTVITSGQPFTVEGIEIMPFRQLHGRVESLGFRIGDVAYSTDVKAFPPESERFLHGLKLWVLDCLCLKEAPTHAHLPLSLEWVARFKPERVILTHMGHDLEYQTLKAQLPAGIEPAYDGLSLRVSL